MYKTSSIEQMLNHRPTYMHVCLFNPKGLLKPINQVKGLKGKENTMQFVDWPKINSTNKSKDAVSLKLNFTFLKEDNL